MLDKQLAGCSGEENQVADEDEKHCRRMAPEHGTGAQASCEQEEVWGGGTDGTAETSAHQIALSTDPH